jgi:hypothetical protein
MLPLDGSTTLPMYPPPIVRTSNNFVFMVAFGPGTFAPLIGCFENPSDTKSFTLECLDMDSIPEFLKPFFRVKLND